MIELGMFGTVHSKVMDVKQNLSLGVIERDDTVEAVGFREEG